jgi:RNA polymerase sigma-70 factor (ECF subfamily)
LSDHSEENESQLVKSLANGNLLAFNTLFKRYGPRLYRFAISYLKSAHDAEELVQEVFTVVWEKRSALKEELSFRSYLFTIAFNLIRKHFRTKKYLSEYLSSGLQEDLDMQTTEKISYDSLHQFLTQLVDKLPVRRKEIFIKSRFEGYSISEISEQMKISHKTVENQLSDALKFIRASLQKEDIALMLFLIMFIF